MSYSTDADVAPFLGPIASRLPAWVTIEAYRDVANATVVDELAKVYPRGIPTFTGNALTVVRWAEAKLAAAEILEAVAASLSSRDQDDTPARLRRSAYEAIRDGVPGYPPGSTDVDGGSPGDVANDGPRVSSFTPVSAFPDPYEATRGSMPGEWRG